MTASLALACALSCAAGALPFILLLSGEKRRHRATRDALTLTSEAAEADRAARLRAEARLDAIHDQHVRAGRAAHRIDEAVEAMRAATVERLRNAAPNPPRPRSEIEAEVAALRAARKALNHPLADETRGERASSVPAGEGFGSTPPLSSRGPAARAPVSLPMMKGA